MAGADATLALEGKQTELEELRRAAAEVKRQVEAIGGRIEELRKQWQEHAPESEFPDV
jgi:hypothetical protein